MTDRHRSSGPSGDSPRESSQLKLLARRAIEAAVRDTLDAQRAETEARLSTALAPVFDWMRNAEAHLAALQADHDRLRVLYETRIAQLDHVLALEARLDDLERAGTAIAVAIAKARIGQETV